ncbi:MAG: hypothetical protein JSW34_03475 [Candidatus Zixiibacteriota bacterium]|nr:MAG: hypothetical protein JSW34_03475 [candidate division Zixibacteria bacterium]
MNTENPNPSSPGKVRKTAWCIASLVTALLLAAACRDDPAVDTPFVENYVGTYMVRNVTDVILMAKMDSTNLVITDGLTYAMSFWEKDELDEIDFCSCEGELDTYTSHTMEFDPHLFLDSNCDTLRVPRGEFDADYVNHGDTVYFEKRNGDSLFQLIVLLR